MNVYQHLMERAAAHAREHGAKTPPVLSPNDAAVLRGDVPLAALHAMGVHVVSWTTNDAEKMRALIGLGVDGIISDRPDILQRVVAEERAAGRLKNPTFDVTGHRGGRGLRPENTLPAFESGLDQLITTIETDTGVTTDHVSLIWHDQFLNPQSCRRADGAEYTLANKVFTRDLSSADAQKTFLCDKLHFGADQKNDLALSPVAVAFAKQEGLMSPYVPTYAEQLFRFVRFYAAYYRSGAGKDHAQAKARADNAERVRFNLETKILPAVLPPGIAENHTFAPQAFVDALCGAIIRNGMQERAEVQSFDFRTLQLIEEQHPEIATYYLTEDDTAALSSEFVPASLRAPKK